MKTATGALQVQRMLKQAPDATIEVFTDEQEAEAWLSRNKRVAHDKEEM